MIGVPAAAPALRLTTLNDAPARARGAYVLYWMVAARRSVLSWATTTDAAPATKM